MWEFVQLQINYADWENPAIQSRGCYEVAKKYGKPVIIMEPVKGGLLANPPQPVAEVFQQADAESSYASWAIRFAANLEGVITVLSGMSNIEQMNDNLSYMKDFTHFSDPVNLPKFSKGMIRHAHPNPERPAGHENADRGEHLCHDRDAGAHAGHPPAGDPRHESHADEDHDRDAACPASGQHAAAGLAGVHPYQEPREQEHAAGASFSLL